MTWVTDKRKVNVVLHSKSVTIFGGGIGIEREMYNGISCLVGAAIVVGIFGLFNWNGFLDLVHIQISQ